MNELIVQLRDGTERTLTAAEGLSVMEIVRDAGIDEMLALCGGCCSCATCHVYVDSLPEGVLPTMSEDENDLLDSAESRLPNSRLSCQLQFVAALSGMRITIAPDA